MQGVLDTTSPTGKLVLTVLAAVAEMEREQIRKRVRSGLAAAKRRGKKLGRPDLDGLTRERVLALADSGLSMRKIAEQVTNRRHSVSKSSVARIFAERRAA